MKILIAVMIIAAFIFPLMPVTSAFGDHCDITTVPDNPSADHRPLFEINIAALVTNMHAASAISTAVDTTSAEINNHICP